MIYAENIFLCIMIPLAVTLFLTRGEVRKYITAFLLGMSMCLLSAYVSGFLSYAGHLDGSDAAVFLSPVVEELLKLFPLLVFSFFFAPKHSVLTMFAASLGAGFATFENCCYILTSGAGKLSYVMIRGMSVGVMHIVSIYALALWLILAMRLKVLSFPVVIGGVSIATIFHALYNLLVSGGRIASMIGYLMPVFMVTALYLLYPRILLLGAAQPGQDTHL